MQLNTLAINAQIQANKAKVFNQPLSRYFEVTRMPEVARLVKAIRETQDNEQRRQLKSQLPFRCPHYYRFANDHRAQADILPEEFTHQTCVDIDDASQVEQALSRAYLINTNKESLWAGHLLHAERSASGKLHLDILLPVGMTVREAQQAYCQELGIDFDEDCCSPERMIYITDEASQLYTSEDWYKPLSEEDIRQRRESYLKRGLTIDGREPSSSPANTPVQTPPTPPDSGGEETTAAISEAEPTAYPADYRGIPYSYIVEELADQLGGAPEHGNRNDFIFTMACHLRHVCNDEAQWIRQVLPDYGEAQERVWDTIQSACKRSQAKGMSKKMQTVLDLCRRRMNAEGSTPLSRLTAEEPQMPERLPAPIRLLTSKAPKMYQPAIATAIFPAFSTLMGGDVKLEYWDNTEMEAGLMVLQAAEFSGGKSSIKKPVNLIVENLEKEGQENRERLCEWNNQVNSTGANQDKPQRPDVCIQVVSSNMTNAALVSRLSDCERAGNKYLFTMMDELEELSQVGGGNIAHVTEIIRRDFDADLYGQERVGTQSITARTPLRWNLVISTTLENAVRFFGKHISNGTFSRLNLCTIIEDKSVDFPIFGKYDDKLRNRLAPYLQRLQEARGLIVCPQAKRLAQQLAKEAKEHAALTDNESYERIARRAVVIAFRKACILYVMNGKTWSVSIEAFVKWSFYYDMWCKMRLFGQLLQKQMEKERSVLNPGMPNMLDLLATSFTRDDLKAVRRRLGKKENPRDQLAQWTKRGFIVKDEQTGLFVKTESYLARHPQSQVADGNDGVADAKDGVADAA